MLELRKKELELMKVQCAKSEMELKIFEREEDIKRLQDNIKNQEQRMEDLKIEINNLK